MTAKEQGARKVRDNVREMKHNRFASPASSRATYMEIINQYLNGYLPKMSGIQAEEFADMLLAVHQLGQLNAADFGTASPPVVSGDVAIAE